MTLDQRPPSPGGNEGDHTGQGGTAEERAQESADLSGVIGTKWGQVFRLAVLVGLVVLLGVTRGLPIVIVILAILLMIFLHELGHYLAARWSGMKATEFFIGFGPKIWSFQRGETEFGLKAIPAGAYVRILGMNNLEEVDPADEPRTYRQQPFRARFNVAVAGSAMHFAVALLLLVVQFSFIGRPDGDKWQIAQVTPGSAAAAAGLRQGDRIVSFDGEAVGEYADFRSTIGSTEPGRVDVVVDRDGTETTLAVDLSRRTKVLGTIGEDLDLLDSGDGVRVGGLYPNGEAEGSGLAEGAEVESINGRSVDGLDDVSAAVADSAGGVVVLTTTQDGTTAEHRVDLGSALSTTEPAAFLGVGRAPVLTTESVPVAVGSSFAEFGRSIGTAVVGVGTFLWPPNIWEFVTSSTGEQQDAASSPTLAEKTPAAAGDQRPISIVGIVMFGSDVTAENLSNLIGFLIMLNIFIGVFNLIPLLPFDGGHVAIAVYEKAQELRRRQRQRYVADVSRMLPVAYGVIMVLVVVGGLALYLDVTRGVPS